MLSFNTLQASVAFRIETKRDLQCKPNDCFYVQNNNRLNGLKANQLWQ